MLQTTVRDALAHAPGQRRRWRRGGRGGRGLRAEGGGQGAPAPRVLRCQNGPGHVRRHSHSLPATNFERRTQQLAKSRFVEHAVTN